MALHMIEKQVSTNSWNNQLRVNMDNIDLCSRVDEVTSSLSASKLLAAMCAIAPVSMLFGMIAYKADWSLVQIFLVSMFGFTGSGQFAALPLSESGEGFITIVFVTALINTRYAFIALSCSKKLPENIFIRLISSHTLGDEAYAIEQGYSQKNMLMARFSLFSCWVISGVLGGVLASVFPYLIPDNVNLGFPASAVLLFLGISQLQGKPLKSGLITIPKILTGFIISGLFYFFLGKVYFWIPSIVVISVFVYMLRREYGK